MYQRLTGKAIKELAAPRTWPAGILPVLVTGLLCYVLMGAFRPGTFALLLAVSILMQSAVNAMNDYFDYVKGTDTAENFLDETDASIIYNHLNPKTALAVGLVFLGLAILGGLFLVWLWGWPLLVMGGVGALVVFLYSGGPVPVSYLPVGEAVSGLVMGGLLPLAVAFAMTGRVFWPVFYYTLPLIISIGLILLTNNTCDVERDKLSGRRTLPALVGQKTGARLLFFGFVVVLALIAHLLFWEFRLGSWVAVPMIIQSIPGLKRIWTMEPGEVHRRELMMNTLRLTVTVSVYYMAGIVLGGLVFG